jgi:DNA polymerase V
MNIDYDKLPHDSIICIDMKSFYASVEAVARNFDPMKVFLAVVGDKKRPGSVVLASSPMLKRVYRIKTGNRLFEIPDDSRIKIVNARMGLYLQKSIQITRLLSEFVPVEAIQVYSIDEAWLKINGTERLFGNKWNVAKLIQNRILKEFKLPSSVGIGPNMFLSKVAMDIEGKEKGIANWEYNDVPEKLWPITVESCWGIGKGLASSLNKMGIKTVGQIASLPLSILENRFGIIGNQLYYHALGVDLSNIEGNYRRMPKNFTKGITLLRDYEEIEEIKTVILELSEDVARRARKEKFTAKTVSLGLGYSREEKDRGFYSAKTMQHPSNLGIRIYKTSLEILRENYNSQIVRKISVSLSNLSFDRAQLNLFCNEIKERKVARVMDLIGAKYGTTAILRARSLTDGGIAISRKNIIGGHKG